ncbi:hypothetical protein SAY87_014720 [Trapa incisa]|uniref:Glycosyltransferase n=1 Tax=Trapa incisa TaxID=236973 RepID=A0AAN7JKL5_9MYRT|nr:hypothetical protein SAY87_014720 [Trapa incisa]
MKAILVPYPAQGHVTPMRHLAAALLQRGYEPVLVTPEHVHRQIAPEIEKEGGGITCVALQDGLDHSSPRDFFAIESAMEGGSMAAQLERLVSEMDVGDCEEDGDHGVGLMVVDVLASWAMEVGHRCGIPTAGFWTGMGATYRVVTAIPEMVRAGAISHSGLPIYEGSKLPRVLPDGQPALTTDDLPWLIGSEASRKGRFRFWTRTVDRCRSLRWLLVNSFPEEHCTSDVEFHRFIKDNCGKKVARDYQDNNSYPMMYSVGPLSWLVPVSRNPSFWQEDRSCLDWLDGQEPGSVTYVSFGSWVGPIGEENVRSLALSLEATGRPFIWVLKPAWRDGLPIGYTERVAGRGKVVTWAPQLEILRSEAVGSYLTHCGWNSTMEAIQCRKKLVCYPVAGDQPVNCRYIVEVWRIGVRIGGFGQEEVEGGLRRVMEDEEMGRRVRELHERTMGEEACLRLAGTFRGFTDDVKKMTEECHVLS